jgi:hypothetical protein
VTISSSSIHATPPLSPERSARVSTEPGDLRCTGGRLRDGQRRGIELWTARLDLAALENRLNGSLLSEEELERARRHAHGLRAGLATAGVARNPHGPAELARLGLAGPSVACERAHAPGDEALFQVCCRRHRLSRPLCSSRGATSELLCRDSSLRSVLGPTVPRADCRARHQVFRRECQEHCLHDRCPLTTA